MSSIKNITLIGSGNVATHLGKSLFKKGLNINQVYSRNHNNAEQLALQVNAKSTTLLTEINPHSDLYIICVKDDVIEGLATQLNLSDKIVAHTSGSISIDAIDSFNNYGIFYPLQTFSKDKEVNMWEVPFCIEGNNKNTQNALFDLAQLLSSNVQIINSEQRKTIHLAAVFACNFTNNMYAIADEILGNNNMSLDILKPLIKETAQKITTANPQDVQTGPAVRSDQAIIKNHLQMLADSKDYQDIYRIITDNIIKQNNGKL